MRAGARALGAVVELHYLSAPVDILFERVRDRRSENPPITREDLVRWLEIFEEPKPEEAALFDVFRAVRS